MGLTKTEMNASGHLISTSAGAELDSAIVNEAAGVVVASVLTMEAAGTIKKYDASSEADCAGICGLSSEIKANALVASYFPNGSELTGHAGLTPGVEYYADPTTGLPGVIGDIGAGEWTRLLGVATSATTMQLQFGPVFQVAS